MTEYPPLEIDGVSAPYDGLCLDEGWLIDSPAAQVVGVNETTKPGDKILNYLPSGKGIWLVNVRRVNPDGTMWGLAGVYARGEWAESPDGQPVCRVWDRLA